jgi:myo-inositol 2-dehydrogenase / D-chiro-inositol 1-dehydrogenase
VKNHSTRTAGVSRRQFISTTGKVAALLSMPSIIPSRLLGGDTAPSNRIRVGQIGCGRIAQGHDMPGVLNSNLADYVAVCDLDTKRVADGKAFVEKFCRDNNRTAPEISMHHGYREILERKDIDAVVVSTPDFWHAELAMAAIQSGKDIYLQKPMTMTVEEGIALRDAVANSSQVFQLGSQQRSWTQFRQACEFVRSGRVGRVTAVEIGLPVDPTAPDDPPQPVPASLDYDTWLGPTPEVYYTEQRVFPQKDYSRPGWLRNESYCLGMITGWGAHHYDTAHWGLNVEHSGPSHIEGHAIFPTNKIWNVHGAYHVELTYPGNVKMTVADTFPNGIRFIGDEGWIFVARDTMTSPTDPGKVRSQLKFLDASDPKLLNPDGLSVHLPISTEHHKNWLECVKSRKPTMAPADIGHRSNTACIVSWIAMKLGRPLDWDVKTERFVNDDEANAMLSRPERSPYGIKNMAKV